jgi:transcriptional regulator with XRE-family HTH domain
MNGNDQNNNPMIRIDGTRAKEIREKKGLTQLYVATAVEVTTETISRWENRRYPSVKAENAEKLAEALEVDLADIIESQAPTSDSPEADQPAAPTMPKLPSPLRRHLSAIILVIMIVVALQAVRYISQQKAPDVTVTAMRTMPAHVPAGQQFPVLLTVEVSKEVSFSLLVREALPPGCLVISTVPDHTSLDKNSGMLKWVSRLEGKSRTFAYLLRSPEVPDNINLELLFKGKVLAGQLSLSPEITGDQRLRISNFHWADQNSDNRIDDEEVLAVYDLYSEIQGLAIDRDLIDEIWASGGYRWDGKGGRYEVLQ